MRRRHDKITYIIVTALLVTTIVLQLRLNKSIFQVIALLLLMLLAAFILVRTLRLTGIPEIVAAVALPGTAVLSRRLADTPLAEYMSNVYNSLIRKSCNVFGFPSAWQIGQDTSITITFWLLFVAILFICNRDYTAMKILRGGMYEELKKRDYIRKRERFCEMLRHRLEALNKESCWDEKFFTPMEAEVDVCIKEKQKKRFADLLKCLKSVKRRGTIFLVLGNPGTGKSVALRKLCLELLGESKRTKKIPVYINLKKWNRDWSLEYLPDKEELTAFIRETLCENGDSFTKAFLKDYFDLMLEDGRWYFIFDSFDELPCFMGKKNCQELIDKISRLLYEFMTDTAQSGGVVASRFYKAPSDSVGATVVLRIQEFSDIKIKMMLQKYLGNAKEVVGELFGKRESLVSLCRNPFYLTLLIDYIQDNGLLFPQNQMELYESFIERRLKKCSGMIESEAVTIENVRAAAKRLAVLMQESTSFGLECPVAALQGKDGHNPEKELKLLGYVQICRLGVDNETISFIHRRFQEFFLVEHIMEQEVNITYKDYGSIISNSGMRDALVLYCEVAEERKAKEIAGFCQNIIRRNIRFTQSILQAESMELVNTLYFMAEAFRNRRSVMAGFAEEFEELVIEALDRDTDFVILLALSNSMVLFRQKTLTQMVFQIFWLSNHWLSDIVMQNCRTIKRLDHFVELQFCKYFADMKMKTFLKRFRNIRFSLSLSKSFRYLRKIHFILFLMEPSFVFTALVLTISMLLHFSQESFIISKINASLSSLQSRVEPFLVMAEDCIMPPMIICILGMPAFFCMALIFLSERSIFLDRLTIRAYFVLLQIMILNLMVPIPAVFDLTCILYLVTLLYGFFMLGILYDLCIRVIMHEIHDAVKKKKPIIQLSKKDILFTLIGICLLIVCFIFKDSITSSIYFKKVDSIAGILEELILLIVLLALIIGLSFWGIRAFICYLKDVFWLKRQPDLRTMTRERLARNLEGLHGERSKKKYIEDLLYKKVELTGEWPDGRRPRQMDDQLEYNLAKLDCLRLENDNYLF